MNTELHEAVERACASIAPSWPLDRFIAVNPFWPRTHKPLQEVAGDLAALSGGRLLMPRAWYAEEWRAGRLRSEHLREAIEESGAKITEEDVLASFWIREPTSHRRPLVVDVLETLRRSEHELSWRDFVMERVSRLCASYFDDGQAQVSVPRSNGLYATWLNQAKHDHMPALFMDLHGYRTALDSLPKQPDEMLELGFAELGVSFKERERYFSALLLDVNGWASWCAYLRWSARIAGSDDVHIRELLAIRLAWEWLLLKSSDEAIAAEWRFAMASWPAIDRAAQLARSEDWILQRALELAWLSRVRPGLLQGLSAQRPATRPRLQAAFCIDVRSEVFRRALEAEAEDIQTFGAAGFFGLPIEYLQIGATHARPQLPGILAPKYRVTDTRVAPDLEKTRRDRLGAANAWKAFKSSSLSSLAFVDSMGLFFVGNLYHDAFGKKDQPTPHHDDAGLTAAENKTRMPRITSHVDGTAVSTQECAPLAENFLRSIGLTSNFSPLVLLVAHGSETQNNAHAAGLDCGACCGQRGDVNARAAAALLNDADVRAALQLRDISIPSATLFVAALHNTTTDEVTLLPEHHASTVHDLMEVRTLLRRASVATRRERAARHGLSALSDAKLQAAAVQRARNWAEVRPEWGLAGNACLIIAPRERTRGVDLEGRAFLHDYRFSDDKDHAVLESIMTGPMVVAHWINFQYYASTVDNARYGCGDKVLHNIVGGHVGVLEGNGGDLRIGLSLQSLHDGERWVHTPVRLAVFIEASQAAIDAVLQRHPKIKELVQNEWLHLFQLDATERRLVARAKNGWKLPVGHDGAPLAL
ncbi:MAG: DUF2309 domain-containing protein [Deltaproteobacteria bacterium]|nr:DUF2309 domain-containing protein [Deltaproteobacteria bacterium]